MKKIFVLLAFCVMIPFNAFAFDICGWWQLEEKPSIFMKITKEKIYGFHYKTSKETEERVEIFVDNSDIPCYLDKKVMTGCCLSMRLEKKNSTGL